jgi:carbamoyltransferase
MTYILGISAFYHDAAACIIKDGRVIAAAQEERFTRVKGDASFPMNAVTYCLEQARIGPNDLAAVAYYDQPNSTFDRIVQSLRTRRLPSWKVFRQMAEEWSSTKLFVRDIIHASVETTAPVYTVPHHLSHAAAAFYPSPFERAAVLTVDGVGEWATASLGVGDGHKLELIKQMAFPDSLGILYSAFTWFCGFKINSGEYKLMGLAPYGEPKYVDLIKEKLAALQPDGTIKLNLDYFAFVDGEATVTDAFAELFGGPARQPETRITRREMDMAASIQAFTEEAMLAMASYAKQVTGCDNLCLAGGVALNCVANGKILRQGLFKHLFIQPAAGDAGSALGAALCIYHGMMQHPRTTTNGQDHMQGSYLGPQYRADEVKTFLDGYNIPYTLLPETDRAATVAKVLADGKFVGLFNGRMEFGPRALGARSILGDPRSPETQRVMNLSIKYRESFRPFAPSVLREDQEKYFDLHEDSPYMLLVAPVNDNLRQPRAMDYPESEDLLLAVNQVRSSLPAITHWDYSARVQSIHADTNPLYHAIVTEFKNLTGVGVVVNTSFNVRGEPIVCTPREAYMCFMRSDIDYLYLDGFWLEKSRQPAVKRDDSWKQEFALD